MERENGVCVQKNKEILTADEAQTANCLPPGDCKVVWNGTKASCPALFPFRGGLAPGIWPTPGQPVVISAITLRLDAGNEKPARKRREIYFGLVLSERLRRRRWATAGFLEWLGWNGYDAAQFMFYPNTQTQAGQMPHPERVCEPLPGSDDGKWIFESIFAALKNKTVAAAA